MILILFNVVGGGISAAAVMSDNYMSDHTIYCNSPAEARAAGVFIDTVIVEPRVVQYGPYTVAFEDCWVEQLRESRRESWYSRRVVTKQARALVNLNLRATLNNQPIADADDSPILTCEQGGGGIYLGQQPQQYLSVYADMLPDGRLNVELPLALTLDYGLKKAPQVCFIAYPAKSRTHPAGQAK
ncbi:hypothetical protein [Hymenobacter frigidus]